MRNNIILLLASLLEVSCGEPPMPPSDDEMIRNFTMHEAAFNKVYEIISDGTDGSHYYPPYKPDSLYLQGLSDAERIQYDPYKLYGEDSLHLKRLRPADRLLLDSLLSVTGCELIHFYRLDKQRLGVDSVELCLTMLYYSHGLSISGTSKCFVYDSDLRNHPFIRITEYGDLNEIYRRKYNDTTLYKPIKGNWYIELDHER